MLVTADRVHQGRLAGTGTSDNGSQLAGTDLKADIITDGLTLFSKQFLLILHHDRTDQMLGFDSDAGCMGIIVQASPAVDKNRICDLNNISVLDPTDPIDADPIHIGPVRTVEIPDQGSLRLQQ